LPFEDDDDDDELEITPNLKNHFKEKE